MNYNRNEIINQLNGGLPIGKNGERVRWCTPISDLESISEVFHKENNIANHVFFGKKEVFSGIKLGLYTPFDTKRDNNGSEKLNHLGQNLNIEDVEPLISKITCMIGEPDEKNDDYGVYRKWILDEFEITIFPRSHHGSDWNAILIENMKCL